MLIMSACASIQGAHDGKERWAVYYSDQADADQLGEFDVLVLDGDVHPDLQKLKENGATVLGYISVGEVHDHKAHEFADSLMVETNEDWGSKRVDIRQPQWLDYIINEAVPSLMDKGFDGVMLDTVDAAIYLEAKDPERFAGSRAAAIYIIRSIKYKNPKALIMLNRGFEILPDVKDSIDMVLAESILSNYDLAQEKATYQPDEIYQQYLQKIGTIMRTAPHIKVYSLDYWDMNDSMGVSRIYSIQRSHGFIPYVTTPDLTNIQPENALNAALRGEQERI